MEIEAVKKRVNHQYIFIAIPWRSFTAPDIVPKIVKAAARVVMSILSHVLKNA